MLKTRIIQVVFWAAMIGVMVLSLLPIDHPDVSSNDKVNHLIAYGFLMAVGAFGFKHLWQTAGVVVLWGVLIEFLQGMTAYRFFSVADMVANCAGVALVYAGIVVINKFKKHG